MSTGQSLFNKSLLCQHDKVCSTHVHLTPPWCSWFDNVLKPKGYVMLQLA